MLKFKFYLTFFKYSRMVWKCYHYKSWALGIKCLANADSDNQITYFSHYRMMGKMHWSSDKQGTRIQDGDLAQ